MARQAVTDEDGATVGWFDTRRATRYRDSLEWDGRNWCSTANGTWHLRETLYRTAGGCWVLHLYHPEWDWWRYVCDLEAAEWLIRCGYRRESEELFPDLLEEPA